MRLRGKYSLLLPLRVFERLDWYSKIRLLSRVRVQLVRNFDLPFTTFTVFIGYLYILAVLCI